MFEVGSYGLSEVLTGTFRLDGGAMFGVVPKVLWEKTDPPDEKNRIELSLRSLLIRGNSRNILVDTGIGNGVDNKSRDIYAIDNSTHTLDRSLKALGLESHDITDVIISHLHFDHVGGATYRTPDGLSKLTFPNAQYFIHKDNLRHAHAPSLRDKASFMEHTITPLTQSKQLRVIDDNYSFADGISALITHGHTPGQILVRIMGKSHVLFCADSIPTQSHIPTAYVMAYDIDPQKTVEEKSKILREAVREDWVLFFDHDPRIAACRVREEKNRIVAAERCEF